MAAGRLRADHRRRHLAARPDVDDRHAGDRRGGARRGRRPAVGWLERHRPRIGGAIFVLLGLVAIGALIFLLVFGGISANSGDISAKMNQALDKIQGWLTDLGVDNTQSAKEDVQ